MTEYTYHAVNEQATERLGALLADLLPSGSVVALIGSLGAGKTRLVQAVAAASGIDVRDVVSPTFVMIHEYTGARPVFHFDVYRVRDDDEFLELGPDEYFEQTGITFVEWADRVERCLPAERLEIRIQICDQSERDFNFAARGKRYEAVVQQLAAHI
jgi:tRNA threonylcarbamoyladenosine biosynthesis protein TsaE